MSGATLRRFALAGAIVAGAAMLVALRQLDGALAAMHPPTEPSYTVGQLADLGLHVPSRTRPQEVVATWERWTAAEKPDGFRGAPAIARDYLRLDTLFVFVYVQALLLLVWGTRSRVSRFVEATGVVAGPDELASAAPQEEEPWTLAAARGYAPLLTLAMWLVPVAGLADVVENCLSLAAVESCGDGCPSGFAYGLAVLAGVKWVALVLVGLPLLFATVVVPPGGSWRMMGERLLAIRVQLLALMVFGLFLFGPLGAQQSTDVLRRWLDVDRGDAVYASAATVVFSLLLLALTWRLLGAGAPGAAGRQPVHPGALGLGALLLIIAGIGTELWTEGAVGLYALAGILGALAILSLFLRGYPARNLPPLEAAETSLPAVVAAAPLVLLGLALVQASVTELAYAAQEEYRWLILGGVVLMAAGLGLYALVEPKSVVPAYLEQARHSVEESTGLWRAGVMAAAFVAVAIALAAVINPWVVGDGLGAVGALAAAMSLLALLGYAVQRFESGNGPPAALAPFGFRRLPILLLVLVWALVSAKLDDHGLHEVRLLEDGASAPVRVEDAWKRWLASQQNVPELTEREATPLVLVAAEGGGIRAAYWTAKVLDCLNYFDDAACGFRGGAPPVGLPRSIFAASGASGGSVGLVNFATQLAERQVAAPEGEVRARGRTWVESRLGEDYLAATWTSLLFWDLPDALLKLGVQPDRAEVLERAWERSWQDRPAWWRELLRPKPSSGPLARGLWERYRADDRFPVLLLSGTSVHDGCRVNVSVLRAAVPGAADCLAVPVDQAERALMPVSVDLVDHLCVDGRQRDVRLSTAALLSARFPWVSPSGSLRTCDGDRSTYVVDGGYLDNSAASPLLHLWEALRPHVEGHNALEKREGPCVVPVFLHLDNHVRRPTDPRPRARPLETHVPLNTAKATRAAHESAARQAAANAFRGRHAYVYAPAQPGTAPPLGWALSQASMATLARQVSANEDTLRHVASWFTPGTLTCADAPGYLASTASDD